MQREAGGLVGTHPDLAANMYRNPADCDADGVDDVLQALRMVERVVAREYAEARGWGVAIQVHELLARCDHVRRLRVAPQGDDRRVLQQQQHVGDFVVLAQLDQPLLQAQRGGVFHGAELDDGDDHDRVIA